MLQRHLLAAAVVAVAAAQAKGAWAHPHTPIGTHVGAHQWGQGVREYVRFALTVLCSDYSVPVPAIVRSC